MGMGAAVFLSAGMILAGVAKREPGDAVASRTRETPSWRITGNPGGPVYGALRNNSVLDGRSAWAVTASGSNGIEADYVLTEDSAWVGDWTETASGVGIGKIRFLFYAGAGGEVDFPAGLNLCIRCRAGDKIYGWNYTVHPSDLKPGWNRVTVGIEPGRPGQWWSPSRTDDQWSEDIASVSAVGLWLAYQPGRQYASQTYGIADFVLE